VLSSILLSGAAYVPLHANAMSGDVIRALQSELGFIDIACSQLEWDSLSAVQMTLVSVTQLSLICSQDHWLRRSFAAGWVRRLFFISDEASETRASSSQSAVSVVASPAAASASKSHNTIDSGLGEVA
jgi:hypothetical protein